MLVKNRAFNAVLWSGFQRFGGLAISFVSNMVLARLLSPEDFGCVGLILIFVSFADVLVDGGLGGALIFKKIQNRRIILLFLQQILLFHFFYF